MWFVGALLFDGAGAPRPDQAFQVRDGRVTWVGDRDEAPPPGRQEEVVDLAGACVLPGLLDVHTHPAFMSGLVDSVICLPPQVGSIDDLVAALSASPAVGGDESRWVEGFGFDESGYPEGRQPNRHDLDRVTADQPVFVRRCDGHSAVANSVALRLAGVSSSTPDPPGAAFGREADGSPDGRLIEVAATDAVAGLIPIPDADERIERVSRLAGHFFERGIVGVGDLLATMIPDPLATFRAAAQRGPFPQVGLYLGWDQIKHDPPTLTDDDRTGRIKVAGVKIFVDGAYSNRTAWTHDCYPGAADHGIRTITDDDFAAAVAWAKANRVQLAAHAMGDAALDYVIDALADDDPWLAGVPSVRLDHCTLFSAERIARVNAARMDFAVISHTIFFFAEYGSYEANLSPAQFEIAYPIRSFVEEVPHTALASDTPATAWADADDVFVSVKAAVLRRSHTGADLGQAEAVTVEQALSLYTSRAATTMPLDGLGRVAVGGEASFVVLDRDVFSVESQALDQVRVAQTWLAGERVYARTQGAAVMARTPGQSSGGSAPAV